MLDGWNPAKPTPLGNENWDVLLDLDGSDALQTHYLRGDAVDELFAEVAASGTPAAYWHLGDNLGSVRDTLFSTGALAESVRYDAYGDATERLDGTGVAIDPSTPVFSGRFGWTGKARDVLTLLQQNGWREYDPKTGRWYSRDPWGFAASDSNLYRYVGNAPTNAIDPSGLEVRHGMAATGFVNMSAIQLKKAVIELAKCNMKGSPFAIEAKTFDKIGHCSLKLHRCEAAFRLPLPRLCGGEGWGEGEEAGPPRRRRSPQRLGPLTPTLSPRKAGGRGGRKRLARLLGGVVWARNVQNCR